MKVWGVDGYWYEFWLNDEQDQQERPGEEESLASLNKEEDDRPGVN